jgi:hypothetical protein
MSDNKKDKTKLNKKQLKINREYSERRYKRLTGEKVDCKFCNNELTLYTILWHLKTKHCMLYRKNLYTDEKERENELNKFIFMIKIIKDKKTDLIINNNSIITKEQYDKTISQLDITQDE